MLSYIAVDLLIIVAIAGMLADGSNVQTAQQSRLSAANAKFALDLYKRQTSPSHENIIMSPLSISVALAMTYLGARGQTKAQMKNVLHFSDVKEDHLHQAFADIQSALNKPRQPYKLYMANGLFGDKSHKFLKEFLAVGKKQYAAELKTIDFRCTKCGATAAAIINKWVAQKTNNKVTDVVSPDDVDASTALVLANAVYFKGAWLTKFDVSSTKDEDFHISPKDSIKVKMMHLEAEFHHGINEELNCAAVELPYRGKSLSMFILLPDKGVTSLSEVEKKMTYDDLVNVTERFAMFSIKVKLWLPRFSLDENLDLSKMLTRIGMKDLFNEGAADLSGIDGSKKLFVSKILHRAVIEVNEEGTEAAAATVVETMFRSAPLEMEFRADRPFIFFIQDKATKSILFLGRLVKPSVKDAERKPLSAEK